MLNHTKWLLLFGVVFITSAPLHTALAADDQQESSYIKVDVKKKPSDSKWVQRDTRTIDSLSDFTPYKNTIKQNKYGGRADLKTEATGFFYQRKVGDRWWLVDPDGHLFIHKAIAGVYRGRSRSSKNKTKEIFGSTEKWADFSSNLLQEYGFNGCGGWSDAHLLRKTEHPPAYTLSWSFMGDFASSKSLSWMVSGHKGYPNQVWPVFHPEFKAFCETYAQKLVPTKDDPYCIGHFSDNELQTPRDMLDRTFKLDLEKYPEMKYNVQEAQRWLSARKGFKAGLDDINKTDRAEYIAHTFDLYFKLTTEAIRKADPNHLCLGSRFHGKVLGMPLVFEKAGKYLDVISINYYHKWDPKPEHTAMWTEQSGKPFMITEWYAKGHDVGLANTSGAGWLVKTQADRAKFYHHFAIGLIESKNCLGWHWFKYVDNDPSDRAVDASNRDSNKGVVTGEYKPYTEVLGPMKRLNENVYNLIDYFDGK